MVIPLPVIDRAISSINVAVAIKKVGLKQGVKVVDLFSRFRIEDTALSNIYQSDPQEEVYSLYPYREGQRLIAETILGRIREIERR